MQLSKKQLEALNNTPLELTPTSESCEYFNYSSETTDSRFFESTVKILQQFGYVKISSGVATITEKGERRLLGREKELIENFE